MSVCCPIFLLFLLLLFTGESVRAKGLTPWETRHKLMRVYIRAPSNIRKKKIYIYNGIVASCIVFVGTADDES